MSADTVDDLGADVHYIEIKALNLEDAKAMVSRRYAAEKGDVHTDSDEVPFP